MPLPFQGSQAQPWRTLPVTSPASVPSPSGPAGSPAGTVTDTFDRGDSTTTINPASDGGLWTICPTAFGTAVWGINGNQAYLVNGSAGVDYIGRDLGFTAAYAQVDITSNALAPNLTESSLIFAWDGRDPHQTGTAYVVSFTKGGHVSVDRYAAGVGSGVDSHGVTAWGGATKTCRIEYDGAGSINIYFGGSLVWTAVDPTPLASPGTWVGFGGDANTMHAAYDYRWNNFAAGPYVPVRGRGWVVGAIGWGAPAYIPTHTDNFNRPDSISTPNPASDGGSWDVSDNDSGDLWGIDGNQLYRTASGALTVGGSATTNNGPGGLTNSPIIRTDAGKAAQDFTIDIATPNDVPIFWPLLNYNPTSRAAYVIAMGSSQGTTVTLWRCVGNAGADRTSLGTWSLSNPGTWPGSGGTSTIRAVHDGSGHITLYQNGTSMGTIADPSTPLAGTWCGIQCNVSGTGGPHFDNFAVT